MVASHLRGMVLQLRKKEVMVKIRMSPEAGQRRPIIRMEVLRRRVMAMPARVRASQDLKAVQNQNLSRNQSLSQNRSLNQNQSQKVAVEADQGQEVRKREVRAREADQGRIEEDVMIQGQGDTGLKMRIDRGEDGIETGEIGTEVEEGEDETGVIVGAEEGIETEEIEGIGIDGIEEEIMMREEEDEADLEVTEGIEETEDGELPNLCMQIN